jgi:hypothetical protein
MGTSVSLRRAPEPWRDLALGLTRACAAQWAASEAEQAAALRKSRARKKAAKRPQKPRQAAVSVANGAVAGQDGGA